MSSALSPLPIPAPDFQNPQAATKPWNVLPFPLTTGILTEKPAIAPLPTWPLVPAAGTTGFPAAWPAPLANLPLPGTGAPAITQTAPLAEPLEPVSFSSSARESASAAELPDFTDDDLRDAFGPIIEQAVRKAVYAQENGIDTYLEPMLRATIRRALAEYAPAARPFQPPGAFDRFIWHVQALFTSRTYEDIFFEKTRRFQVEEVFLLDSASLALVSFASCDPARHASVRRVSGTANRLALQLRDEKGIIRESFELSDHRRVIARQGSHVVLMALVRGNPGELAFSDLEFALRRIEDHFREQFKVEGSSLLYPLQPFLEDCLLIQAPASAA